MILSMLEKMAGSQKNVGDTSNMLFTLSFDPSRGGYSLLFSENSSWVAYLFNAKG
jgi:hypothetical protein